MSTPNNSWSEYLARLEQEMRNGVDAEGFRHAQITRPSGDSITFRNFSDLRAELNFVRAEVYKENIATASFSPFFAECAP